MSRKYALLAGASILMISTNAFAQDAAQEPVAVEEDTGGLEEIVVTAQKREQNMQSVPVAVTALGAEAIENARIADFSDLTRAAPSLTITQTTSSPNNAIVLRGIGTFAFSIGVEPSVAVIIDDMPVVQQAQAFDNLADLQRIEVLKGPQGTLFGKSSSAGVVNIVTNDPDNDFMGNISATAATDGDVRLEGVVSIPVGEGAGVRLTGFYHNYPGNIHNLTSNTHLNDQENYGVRAKFKSELTDTLTFTLTGAYSKAEQDGTATSLRGIFGTGTPSVFGAVPLIPTLVGITPGTGNYRSRVDALGATANTTKSVAGKFNLDLGFANLISVTAYQDWKFNFQNDFDGTDANVLGALTGGTANGGIAQAGPYHSTNLSQELRLVSSGNDALKYVVGAFYSDAETDRAFLRGPVVARANWEATNGSKSLGLFAQLDYTLPTETTISAGVRYNREKISVAFDNLLGTTANACAPNTLACRGSNTDSVITWKGSISQQVAPDVMVFGSIARGYKGFAYDIVTGFNPARIDASLNGTGPGLVGVGPIQPEKSDSYELGIKSRFLDNRVQLNVIGFYTDYDNFQAQSAILVGTPPAPQFVLNNVGKLRTKGVEVELQAKPTDWLRLDAGATYTDATMTSFPNAQGYAGQTGAIWNGTASALQGNCTSAPAATAVAPRTLCSFQDRSGAQLPNSPKFKWNVGATADFALMGDATGTLILNYQHQSKVSFDLLGNPLLEQPAYGVFNGSFGVQFANIKVTAFVNNLFNKHYASSMADNFGVAGGSATNDTHPVYQFLSRDSQRYGGIKLGISF
ncbi:TonB-dependent receptor [uncultured Sphingorhabdus sp.]|uniref:TonB-dependent receptor n=1 Tax=uncultured Sphingorhabdus sp. TaxID=1686106 RepID=UPI002635B130|nr:TonB-dependent receptor [uncultured Sphingorhabdus sp.]HMS19483.1 TonB-dependent receptor [Sphingorhabdus sp.]